MRKLILISVLISLMLILSGCEDIAASIGQSITDMVYCGMTFGIYCPGNSKNTKMHIDVTPPKTVTPATSQCPSKETYDVASQKCVCDQGYFRNSAGDCVRTGGCTFDADCGGSSCSDSNTKAVRRCDLRSYVCYTEFIDCKDYGQNYKCSSGQCIV